MVLPLENVNLVAYLTLKGIFYLQNEHVSKLLFTSQ